jgi:hypothetical protein
MAMERELHMDSDSEVEICIDDENGNLPSQHEPSSRSEDNGDKKVVEPKMVRGRPEATEMWVLLSHSLVHHLGWHFQLLHTVPPTCNC